MTSPLHQSSHVVVIGLDFHKYGLIAATTGELMQIFNTQQQAIAVAKKVQSGIDAGNP